MAQASFNEALDGRAAHDAAWSAKEASLLALWYDPGVSAADDAPFLMHSWIQEMTTIFASSACDSRR